MEETKIGLREKGAPRYEKLVWQGEWNGLTVRVRIVRQDEEAVAWTHVERWAVAADKAERWIEHYGWSGPGSAGMEQTLVTFVEGMIDLMGRPEWDTRTPLTTSLYPSALTVAE